ncbi:translation initiation factor IF-3 [Lacisediminihabitans changchengi]|uniref:translation initiation factor IF-3 n=1 Tax=Lacisediminihabitans changchengi TaxID=2787634 RepID=UPI003559181C
MPEVRLVGPNGEQVGVVRIEDAIRLAQEADLDLVEVAPNSKPPVAKIMDFGKFKYETAQKAKEAKRNQSNTILKEVRFRLKIDVHDYETKRKRAEGFLQQGDKVKAMILFRGREQSRPEQGVRLLQRFAEDVAEFGTVESTPTIDGRNMVMVIGPLKTKAEVKAEHDAKKPTSRTERPESTDAPAAVEAAPAPKQPVEQPLATFAKAPPRPVVERSAPERSSSDRGERTDRPERTDRTERPDRTERSAPARSSAPSSAPRSSAPTSAPRSAAPSSSGPSSAPQSSAAPAARVASAAGPAAKIAAAAPAATAPSATAAPAASASAPAETKPAETKPAETKPAESKPAETKPAATKPAATKPAAAATPGAAPKPAPKPGASTAVPKPAAKSAPKTAPKTAPADSPTN